MKDFVLNNLDLVLSLLLAVGSIISTIIINIKTKKKLKIEDIKVAINSFIADAENLKNYTGEEKKNYVITRALQISKGIMKETDIDAYIESQVALTNVVNTQKKGGANGKR